MTEPQTPVANGSRADIGDVVAPCPGSATGDGEVAAIALRFADQTPAAVKEQRGGRVFDAGHLSTQMRQELKTWQDPSVASRCAKAGTPTPRRCWAPDR